ncbi:MAG TPA: hypothetical protein VKR52_15655 [Terracidiphilus sp.]|nr:hypothetical protein [Terracidiphilus sp.]
MPASKRPISIVILACVYLLVGCGGFVMHFPELLARHPDAISIEVTELIAVLCGIFLLVGKNWARWLALAWIVFHVAISVGQMRELIIHSAICAVIAFILFRPPANQYFRGPRIQPS